MQKLSLLNSAFYHQTCPKRYEPTERGKEMNQFQEHKHWIAVCTDFQMQFKN